ncbi:type I-E CRISPR-associated protein Cas7/Cse4/CasC [Oribacterium parvum]|jgi:cse4 family CRISPR-associated protein|uniref:type I-E CRISPR-associated protein Cas7/Cse4/CasC n=1 Tax=Oribacterium parvum TaxID=1501329 RepID=UPI0028DB685E|nr:type I-E CRISPR-associated protein Cas7/Cse4/CasC [Oribacterium parvum]
MSKEKLFLDIHVIQTLPPSNINRDDTGSPKTAVYGGVRRARVSSQAWKKAMRDYFKDKADDGYLGVRSKKIVEYVAKKILEIDETLSFEEAEKKSLEAFTSAGFTITEENKLPTLFFLGDRQAGDFARAALDNIKDASTLHKIIKDNVSIDIALFGRMIADKDLNRVISKENEKSKKIIDNGENEVSRISLNEDASSQIAHAISTHGVQTEFDYFTALDDLSKDAKPGAAMIDTIEYNSSTLYRYGNVALHEFYHQMKENKEETQKAIILFVEAFLKSLPSGKINSFANQTIPSSVVVSLRKDRPVSLVSAFETPIKTKLSQEGYVNESIEAMFKEYQKIQRFVDKPEISFYLNLSEGHVLEGAKEEINLSDLLNDLGKELNNRL